jgi:hypothetical protein
LRITNAQSQEKSKAQLFLQAAKALGNVVARIFRETK